MTKPQSPYVDLNKPAPGWWDKLNLYPPVNHAFYQLTLKEIYEQDRLMEDDSDPLFIHSNPRYKACGWGSNASRVVSGEIRS